MRPIDADSLMSDLNPQHLANRGFRFAGVRSGRTIELAKLLLIKLLEDTPTIYAVPVVRCIECKFSSVLDTKGLVACLLWSRAFPCDGFCHEGEKEG